MSKKTDVTPTEEVMKNQVGFEETKEEVNEAAALRSEVEKIIAEAKAAAAAIIENAKKAVEPEAMTAPTNAANDPYFNELVPVMLFKDNNKYKDDVFVAVNGESCLIQRGKPVKIKRKFALVLEQSQYQDMATADLINGMESEYKEKEHKLTQE